MIARLLSLALFLAAAAVRAGEADPLATLRPGHPRLLLPGVNLQDTSDPLRVTLHARIVAAARTELAAEPIRHVLVGPRLLDQSRRGLGRILTCALAYRLTGETAFAARATREMLVAAAFPDWNPSHFLDVAELSLALAVGYDWLYDQLSPADRATIKDALLRHALAFAPSAYGTPDPADKRVWFVKAHHNWNQVCNGGLLAAALALADEEPGLARQVIRGARRSLPLAMAAYQPDGAYPEGPGYWGYGTSYNVLAIAMLESALGTDLGLAAEPAFDRTALYRLHIQGPSGAGFNHADGGPGLGAQAEYTWLAQRFRIPAALAHSRALLASALTSNRASRNGDRFFALHALWFPAAVSGDEAPLDARFRGPSELAVFRSAWGDPRALYLGFKAGSNAVNHSHLDLGSFVFEAGGVRWAEDLGSDNYNLPGYFGKQRWSYYRLSNLSHNTLTPAGKLQDPKAAAPITAFASRADAAFAVADLSGAYAGVARRWQRGVSLPGRTQALVQDELHGLTPGTPLAWRMVTHAKVVLDGPHRARLTAAGQSLLVEVLEPAEARLTTTPAKPTLAAEKQNEGYTAIAAELTATQASTRIRVRLVPLGPGASPPAPAAIPLSDWK